MIHMRCFNAIVRKGNGQVDPRHLGGHDDLTTWEYQEDEQESLNACQQNGTPAIAQICHPGRQSPRGASERDIFEKPIAPSEVPLKIGDGCAVTIVRNMVFSVPQAMTQVDIDRVIVQFIGYARVLAKCGFSGIEIYVAHGYLYVSFPPPFFHRLDAIRTYQLVLLILTCRIAQFL
jgi:2,4-dienoyl-CoA reductase-like NADH-dependent reductase (Old Yellow Enzyme family)